MNTLRKYSFSYCKLYYFLEWTLYVNIHYPIVSIDDESHFFLFCKINNDLRKYFDNFHTQYNDLAENKINNLLNPTITQQVKSLCSFIKLSLGTAVVVIVW